MDLELGKIVRNNENKKIEDLKLEFSKKIDDLLGQRISPENIDHFYDIALDKASNALDFVVKLYKQNSELADATYEGKEMEDEAIKFISDGDPNFTEKYDVNNIISKISEKQNQINLLEQDINNAKRIDTVLVRPDKKTLPESQTGGHEFKTKELKPRLKTLLYILQNEFGLEINRSNDKENPQIEIFEGDVKDNMLRNHPYYLVDIIPLNRIFYICDEEDNATFIFDKEVLNEIGLTLDELNHYTKNDFRALMEKYPDVGIRIIYQASWRDDLYRALTEDFESIKKDKKTIVKFRSDFSSSEKIPAKKHFPGWESAKSIGRICGVNAYIIRQAAEKYNDGSEDWRKLLNTSGNIIYHYRPDITQKLLEEFNVKKSKDYPGWETANQIAVRTGRRKETILELKDKLIGDRDDWIQNLKTGKHNTEHFSPELIKLIEEELEKNKGVEDFPGWETETSLARILKVDKEVVRKVANLYKFNPDFFKTIRVRTDRHVHFSPELVVIISDFIRNPPQWSDYPNWIRPISVVNGLKIKFGDMNNFVENFRASNPEWFKFLKKDNKLIEFYHPELIDKIKENFGKLE